jgi:hypothetical protein
LWRKRWQRTTLAVAAVAALGFLLVETAILANIFGSAHPGIEWISGRAYLQKGAPIHRDNKIFYPFDTPIRVDKDQNAHFLLPDGSKVEISRRSRFTIRNSNAGPVLHLMQGQALVEASKTSAQRILSSTPDFDVVVQGTVYALNSGSKGSRCSVLEGAVQIQDGSQSRTLSPGQQYNSQMNLMPVSLAKDVSWVEQRQSVTPHLHALGHAAVDLAEHLDHQEIRYHSTLLPLLNTQTQFYLAFPNVGEAFSDFFQKTLASLANHPQFRDGFHSNLDQMTELNVIFDQLGQISSLLGNEIAIGQYSDSSGSEDAVILAEHRDQEALVSAMQQIKSTHPSWSHTTILRSQAELSSIPDDHAGPLCLVDSQILIITGSKEGLQETMQHVRNGGNPAFLETRFFQNLSELYATGVVIISGFQAHEGLADIADGQHWERLGLDGLDMITFIKRKSLMDSSFEMAISFQGDRTGISGWLDQPAALSSLNFLSPDTLALSAVNLLDMDFIVNDLQQWIPELQNLDQERVLNLLATLSSAIGGEFCLALDGPVLPKPAFKVLVEVYDFDALIQGLRAILAEVNGEETHLSLTEESLAGQTVYALHLVKPDFTLYLAHLEGFLLIVPNAVMVQETANLLTFNVNIKSHPDFQKLIPANSYNGYSALLYQNLLPALNGLLTQVGSQNDPELVQSLMGVLVPNAVTVYAERDQILIASEGAEQAIEPLIQQLLDPKSDPLRFLNQWINPPQP